MHHGQRDRPDRGYERQARRSQEWTPIYGGRCTGGAVWRVEQCHRVADVAQPALRVFFEASRDQRSRGRRHPAERRLVPQHGGKRLRHVAAGEGSGAGQHLVEHAAEGPDVGALVHGLAARLFRAHVGGRAEDHARLRHRRRRERRRVRTRSPPPRSLYPRRAPWRGRSRAPSPCRPAAP